MKAAIATAIVLSALALSGCGSKPAAPTREDRLVGTWACDMVWAGWHNTATLEYGADRNGVVTMHALGSNRGVRVDMKFGFEMRWELRGKMVMNDFRNTQVFWARANGVPAAGEGETDMLHSHLEKFETLRRGDLVELEADHIVLGRGEGSANCTRSA